jgi:S1-C subfamily serine protease
MKKTLRWMALVLVLVSTLSCQIFFNGTQKTPQLTAVPTPTSAVSVLHDGSNLDPLAAQNLLVSLYEHVSPGIVLILVTSDQGGGLGSGFVYDTEGHILTNYHVVEGATSIEVDFPSGFKSYGKVVGTDLDSDLAVLKVEGPASEFKPLPLGDSNQLKVGQSVVAIGNPFGLNGTMTQGIISSLGRTGDSLHQTSEGGVYATGDIIQTDAAINPGNSGGPLLNLNGEVIGIIRAIQTTNFTASGDPSNSGIAFAVSVGIAKRVTPFIIKDGKYDYPYLGIKSLNLVDLTLSDQAALGLSPTTGVYLTDVVPGGPAEKAGLVGGSRATDVQGLMAGGDLIIAVDGRPVRLLGDLLSYVMNNKGPGDTIVLTISRDNQEKEVTVTLGKRP